MKMKMIGIAVCLALTSGCAARYQSFTAGDGLPDKTMLQKASSDLVDSYASLGGVGAIRLHTAKGDNVFVAAIENRLRVNGFSVMVIQPGSIFKRTSVEDKGTDLRYRASYYNNIGTYCLGIGASGSQIMCRMYEGSEPISSITTRGFDIRSTAEQIPVKDQTLSDDVLIANRDSIPTTKKIVSIPASITESSVFETAVLGGSTAFEPQHSPAPVPTPKVDELSIIETSHLNNDELRSVVDRYTKYLPERGQTFVSERLPGETDQMHRQRLLKQMRVVYSYQYHDGVGYE